MRPKGTEQNQKRCRSLGDRKSQGSRQNPVEMFKRVTCALICLSFLKARKWDARLNRMLPLLIRCQISERGIPASVPQRCNPVWRFPFHSILLCKDVERSRDVPRVRLSREGQHCEAIRPSRGISFPMSTSRVEVPEQFFFPKRVANSSRTTENSPSVSRSVVFLTGTDRGRGGESLGFGMAGLDAFRSG